MNKKSKTIGIIAEDTSDVECLKEIIRLISKKNGLSFKYFVGKGCGKIKRKCKDWSIQLKERGCNVLILVHDLDRNNLDSLKLALEKVMKPYAIGHTFISIPITELEAWLIADPKSIQVAINLPRTPKITNNPESIASPKEHLRDLISKYSNDTKIYLNTKHNELIVKNMSIDVVKAKSPSFNSLFQFVSEVLN